MREHIYLAVWACPEEGTPAGLMHILREEDGRQLCVQSFPAEQLASCVRIDEANRLLFLLTNGDKNIRGGCGGAMLIYRIDEDGELTLCRSMSSCGTSPIDMVLFPDSIAVLNHGSTTNRVCRTEIRDGQPQTVWMYDEASLVLFEREADGLPGKVLDLMKFTGEGPVPFFQESAAPHSLGCRGTTLLVPERGSDRTTLVSAVHGRLLYQTALKEQRGAGPRNAVMTKNGQEVYVVDEILPRLVHYKFPNSESTQVLSTVSPEAAAGCTANPELFTSPHPSAVLLAEDERTVYTLTRSTNTIAVFRRNTETGELTLLQEKKLQGENPRELLRMEDGLYIICLDTKNCIFCTVDPATGEITGESNYLTGIPGIAAMAVLTAKKGE